MEIRHQARKWRKIARPDELIKKFCSGGKLDENIFLNFIWYLLMQDAASALAPVFF